MNKNRPETTLFMLESLDGKITLGDNDALDVDKNFKSIAGLKEGLPQYYELEQKTDLVSLNTGRVMAKIGINDKQEDPKKMEVSFVIIDSKPHLTESGVEYLAKWVKTLYLVTTNKDHPAFKLQEKYPNIEIITYGKEIALDNLLDKMKTQFGIEKITIQSGGTLNSHWVRQGLIDHISIVIAPCLIGGNNTQSLIGGESIHSVEDLSKMKILKLVKCDILKDSYIHASYDVINTRIEA